MSARRQSWADPAGVTTDELLEMLYGHQTRREHAPMPGCRAVCCWPGPIDRGEAALWLVVWSILASEAAVVVGAVAIVLTTMWRWLGGQ